MLLTNQQTFVRVQRLMKFVFSCAAGCAVCHHPGADAADTAGRRCIHLHVCGRDRRGHGRLHRRDWCASTCALHSMGLLRDGNAPRALVLWPPCCACAGMGIRLATRAPALTSPVSSVEERSLDLTETFIWQQTPDKAVVVTGATSKAIQERNPWLTTNLSVLASCVAIVIGVVVLCS